jgi:deoxyribodipyrimidine photo-lyase
MSDGEMPVALWWIRRDLRLHDTPALCAALEAAGRVLPVFVLDPALWERSPYVGDKRRAFLLGSLRALDEDLRARGSRLVLRRGDPVEVLARLVRESGAGAVFAQGDVSPYARRRDRRVAEALPLRRTGGLTVRPLDAVRKRDGGPYRVYSPYRRTWMSLSLPAREDLLPAPERIPTPEGVAGMAIPEAPALPASVPFPPGEAAARRRLTRFTEGAITRYAEDRDRMDRDGTSRLSPYLRFGVLSPRAAMVAALEADGPGAKTWRDELIWREFYLSVLYHFPQVRERSFRAAYRDVAWRDDPAAFTAWQEGRTGYPVVDAGMRQLRATGWMHNRARMIVAAFLAKDLLIHWRKGERHFMQHLVDGDPAANNGGWQWSAGTGTDAAPYFRVFNPVLQGEKHDPQGAYVRRWVPELAQVPTEHVHSPWEMSPEEQVNAGCIVGEDYPAPIVDHPQARERALATYRRAREDEGGDG